MRGATERGGLEGGSEKALLEGLIGPAAVIEVIRRCSFVFRVVEGGVLVTAMRAQLAGGVKTTGLSSVDGR